MLKRLMNTLLDINQSIINSAVYKINKNKVNKTDY